MLRLMTPWRQGQIRDRAAGRWSAALLRAGSEGKPDSSLGPGTGKGSEDAVHPPPAPSLGPQAVLWEGISVHMAKSPPQMWRRKLEFLTFFSHPSTDVSPVPDSWRYLDGRRTRRYHVVGRDRQWCRWASRPPVGARNRGSGGRRLNIGSTWASVPIVRMAGPRPRVRSWI